MTSALPHRLFQDALRSKMLFISGKGGVGKTTLSQALAASLAEAGRRTLWLTFEDPAFPESQEPLSRGKNLWYINAITHQAFEEYMGIKLGAMARFFAQNKLIRFLLEAAPGLTEQVLLGKVWHERDRYDHIVVDMPSTGYGVAMFQSVLNFHTLFHSGPLARDAGSMLESFRSRAQTAQIIVGLPEETPLRESLDLAELLLKLFPENPPAFVLNRRFPQVRPTQQTPGDETLPLSRTMDEFVVRRVALEAKNMTLWSSQGIAFSECDYMEGNPLSALTARFAQFDLSGRAS